MRSSRAVTALAPGVLGRFLAGSDALEVRILVKFRPDVRMAGLADIAPDEAVRRIFRGLSRWLLGRAAGCWARAGIMATSRGKAIPRNTLMIHWTRLGGIFARCQVALK